MYFVSNYVLYVLQAPNLPFYLNCPNMFSWVIFCRPDPRFFPSNYGTDISYSLFTFLYDEAMIPALQGATLHGGLSLWCTTLCSL